MLSARYPPSSPHLRNDTTPSATASNQPQSTSSPVSCHIMLIHGRSNICRDISSVSYLWARIQDSGLQGISQYFLLPASYQIFLIHWWRDILGEFPVGQDPGSWPTHHIMIFAWSYSYDPGHISLVGINPRSAPCGLAFRILAHSDL